MDDGFEWLKLTMDKKGLAQCRIDRRYVVFEPHLYGRGLGNRDVVLGYELHGHYSQTEPGWQIYPAHTVEPTDSRGRRAAVREIPIEWGPQILEVYHRAK
jgi:hypothetical protein